MYWFGEKHTRCISKQRFEYSPETRTETNTQTSNKKRRPLHTAVRKQSTPAWPPDKTNYDGKNFTGSKNCSFSKTRDLLGGRANNTSTPQDAPRSFRELSWTVFRFSRVLVWFLPQPTSFVWRVKNKIVRTRARNSGGILKGLGGKSSCPQNWQFGRTVKLRLWRNGKLFKKALEKLRGASWGIYRCFSPSRRVNYGFSAKRPGS